MTGGSHSDVVMIMAPIGADAANIHAVLQRADLAPRICRTIPDVEVGLAGECGAIVLTEEALTAELKRVLGRFFEAQPPWSDIPVVLISSMAALNPGPVTAEQLRGPRRTITLLERPLGSTTLVATLHTLLAARHRQYEIRDLLHERGLSRRPDL